MVVVFEWVCDNIWVFGGDFDNVMFFGELVGVNVVMMLMCVLVV